MRINLSSSNPLRAFAIFAVVSMIVVPLNFAVASPPPTPDIRIGTNAVLNAAGLNVASTSCGANTHCTSDPNAGYASSSASLTDQTADVTGEAQLGWNYRLVPACSEQNTATAAFTLRYDYGYNIAASKSALSTSTASATINARADTGSAAIPLNTTIAASTPTSVTGTGSQVPLANVHITANHVYATTLGAASRAKLQDTVLPGETASSSANVTPTALSFDFLDKLPPQITAAGTIPAAVNGGGAFLGYLNSTSAQLYVDAHDQNVTGLAMSCVAQVTFTANGVPQTVNFTFSQTRATTPGVSGEGDHNTLVTASDYAGNPTTPTSFDFILDTVAPTSSVAISPAAPTGKNGWWDAPGPAWQIHCERDPNGIGPGQTAPCLQTDLSQDNGATFTHLGTGPDFAPAVAESAAATAMVRSEDKALNWNSGVSTPTSYPVDITPPSVYVNQTNSSLYNNNGWHRVATSVTIECSDRTSGCAGGVFQTQINGGAPTSTSTFSCTTDSIQDISFHIEDLAGNPTTGSLPFRCDFTRPADITGFAASSTFVNSTTSPATAYSTVAPTWSWTAGQDVSTNGVQSGVLFYEVQVDGVPGVKTAATNSYSDASLPDGNQCISARSVDAAGNRGNWTTPICVFVDRVNPNVGWNMPAPSTLYLQGAAVSVPLQTIDGLPAYSTVNQSITTLVIGDIQVSITPNDPTGLLGGDSSNLERAQLILDQAPFEATKTTGAYQSATSRTDPNNQDKCQANTDCQVDGDHGSTPCDITSTDIQTETCTWNDNSGPNADGRADRFLYAKAMDRSQRSVVVIRNYEKVRIAEVEEAADVGCSAVNGTCNTFWHDNKIDPGNFTAWVLYRASNPVGIDQNPANIVQQTTDITNARIQDPNLLPNGVANGQPLYYKLVAIHNGAETLSFPTMQITHHGNLGAASVQYVST